MMKLLPITLTAKRGNWQKFMARKKNPRFGEVEAKIFKRDNNTCRYCGFQSKKFQEIVNHDGDYKNNKSSNLVTACSFCTQCLFLDSLNETDKFGGHVIYLPEVSQADLNHFCRALFTSLLKESPYKGKLQTTYLSFKERGNIVDDIFGPESHMPDTFGQALIDSELTQEQLKHPIMKNLRLLPDKKYFGEQSRYWKRTVFDQIPL